MFAKHELRTEFRADCGVPMYPLLRFLVWAWFQITSRPRIVHPERFPDTGSAILAANHHSAADTTLIPAMTRRKLGHVAKRELFTDRRPFHRLLGWFIHWAGARPMDRAGGRASASSMRGVLDHLADGGAVVVFPEGTRSPDGRLYKGKTGVARLALASGAPVIPIGLVNTRRRKVGRWPFRILWHPEIRMGEPLDFSQWREHRDDRDVLRHVTNEVMAAIQRLTGQTYVDVYGASLRSAKAAGRELAAHELPYPGYGVPAPELAPDAVPDESEPRADE